MLGLPEPCGSPGCWAQCTESLFVLKHKPSLARFPGGAWELVTFTFTHILYSSDVQLSWVHAVSQDLSHTSLRMPPVHFSLKNGTRSSFSCGKAQAFSPWSQKTQGTQSKECRCHVGSLDMVGLQCQTELSSSPGSSAGFRPNRLLRWGTSRSLSKETMTFFLSS